MGNPSSQSGREGSEGAALLIPITIGHKTLRLLAAEFLHENPRLSFHPAGTGSMITIQGDFIGGACGYKSSFPPHKVY
jgi:hypothetical protein